MKIYRIVLETKERKLGEKLNEDINVILSSWKRKERAILSQKEIGGVKKQAFCGYAVAVRKKKPSCPCSPKKKRVR